MNNVTLKHFIVELKTNNGHIKWEVYAESEADARYVAVKEVTDNLEVSAYKVESISEDKEEV